MVVKALDKMEGVLTILIELIDDGDVMFELEIVVSEGDWSDAGVVGRGIDTLSS